MGNATGMKIIMVNGPSRTMRQTFPITTRGTRIQVNHPMVTPVWPALDGSPLWNTLTEADVRDHQVLSRGPPASLTQAAVLLRSGADRPVADIQLTLTLLGMTAARTPIEDPVLTCAVRLLDPDNRGTVRLADTDPAGAPLADPGFLTGAAAAGT